MKGIVKAFFPDRGYGFIESEDGQNFFVHYTDIRMKGYKVIYKDDIVSFDLEDTPKGAKAVNVRRME